MRRLSFLFVIATLSRVALATDFAPALQWVTPLGAARSLVTAAASDGHGNLYVTGSQATAGGNIHVFVAKLDIGGNIVYSTTLGGSSNDTPVALAAASDGSLFITGSTGSTDFPVTPGAYLTQSSIVNGTRTNFVVKLKPDGSIAWATYFPAQANVAAIAVDSAGNPFIAGSTAGGLPTTPGVYQTTFQQLVTSNGFFSVIGPLSAFVTKLKADGSGLIYSTYVPKDTRQNVVAGTQALAVDASGNAWFGVATNPGIVPSGPGATIVELNPTGSAIVASVAQAGLDSVTALALDANSNVYVAGGYRGFPAFPATPGAYQPVPQPVFPAALTQYPSGGGLDVFVAKWDSSLTHLLAATLLGGEYSDSPASIAIDAAGTVIVAGSTESKAFPTHAPFQESFASRAGFVAGFDSNLSNLVFSTYLGDGRAFSAQGAFPDGSGGILLAGSTLSTGYSIITEGNGTGLPSASLAFANRIALLPAPAVRLDSVRNFASRQATPIAPGEVIVVAGAGFGDAAQIVLDGALLMTLSATATSVVAMVPANTITSGTHTLQVSSNGAFSNSVYAPAAPAAPGVYSVDGSGTGQAYILNSDGTRNSPSNPAAAGSAITIFITGAGQYSLVNGYAVTTQMPAVFIDSVYCYGIAAVIGPVDGLPGNVYQLSVFVPDPADLAKNNPDLKNFRFPPQSAIWLQMVSPGPPNPMDAPMFSPVGVVINIK